MRRPAHTDTRQAGSTNMGRSRKERCGWPARRRDRATARRYASWPITSPTLISSWSLCTGQGSDLNLTDVPVPAAIIGGRFHHTYDSDNQFDRQDAYVFDQQLLPSVSGAKRHVTK